MAVTVVLVVSSSGLNTAQQLGRHLSCEVHGTFGACDLVVPDLKAHLNKLFKNKKFVGFIDPGSFYGHNELEVSYLRWFNPKFIDENFLDKYNDHIKIDKYYLEYEPIYQLYYSLLNVYLWDRSYIENVRGLLDKTKI